MLSCIQYQYSIILLITNLREKHNTEHRYSHIKFLLLMSSGVIDLFISRQCSIARFRGRRRWLPRIAHIYISLSLYPSRRTRSIPVGRSATEKESAPRVVNVVERSRRVGRTVRQRFYTALAIAGETETIYIHVSPYTERTHAEILWTPTGQISTVTRYEVLSTRLTAKRSIGNVCNSKRLSPTRAETRRVE